MIYTIENHRYLVRIKELGAELTSFLDKKTGRELLWQGDPAIWNGQSPVLFPVVGRLADNQYRYQGRTYEMGLHGFARKMAFELESQGDSAITLSLRSTTETKVNYPFDFLLLISYQLREELLEVHYLVQNLSETEPMYFSLGAHPGFNCAGPISQQVIRFSAPESLDRLLLNDEVRFIREVEEDFVKEGAPICLNAHSFDHDALVFKGFSSDYVTLTNAETGEGVRMNLEGWPYLGFWSMPGADYVCLEPWFGIGTYADFAGELPDKDGIQKLAPLGIFKAAYTVESLLPGNPT